MHATSYLQLCHFLFNFKNKHKLHIKTYRKVCRQNNQFLNNLSYLCELYIYKRHISIVLKNGLILFKYERFWLMLLYRVEQRYNKQSTFKQFSQTQSCNLVSLNVSYTICNVVSSPTLFISS